MALGFGDTQQLPATLTLTTTPLRLFLLSAATSSNDALLTVDSNGLYTAASPDATVLTSGGQVTVTVTYQFIGTNAMSAQAIVTDLANEARTQTVVILESTRYGITSSLYTVSHLVPASGVRWRVSGRLLLSTQRQLDHC